MIRFAGVDLLLDDPGGRIAAWLDRYLPLDDLRLFGPHQAAGSPMWQAKGASCSHLGIPTVNYPPPPRMRLNVLTCPTGATRWTWGLFLTDDAGIEAILAKMAESGAGYDRGKLILSDSAFAEEVPDQVGFHFDPDERVALVTELRMLQPRPISALWDTGSPTPASRLWILPLVDDRYYWQFAGGDLGDTSSFDALVGSLADVLNIDTPPTVDSSGFGTPDQTEVSRNYQNAAVLLDAVAFSLGCRVVRRFASGDVELQSPGTAASSSAIGLDRIASQCVAGGLMQQLSSSSMPAIVEVVFRDGAGGTNAVPVTAESLGFGSSGTNGQTKTFHVPSIDPFDGAVATAESLALATAIATAHFDYCVASEYDVALSGIQAWGGAGTDDFVQFIVGARNSDGSYIAMTRACSMPPNVGVDVLLNRADDGLNEDDCVSYANYHGCADADWVAGGTVVVSIYDETGTDTGRNITCNAIDIDGLAGTKGDVIRIQGLSTGFRFWPTECDPTCGVSA